MDNGVFSRQQTNAVYLLWLKRKGFHLESLPCAVPLTAENLASTVPFHGILHGTLIEQMMTHFLRTTLTTEHILYAVQSISTDESDLYALDMEDAFLLWIDQVGKAYDNICVTPTSSGMGVFQHVYS